MQPRTTTFKATLWATLAASAMLADIPASHATCSTDPYIASICITAANYCPRGYLNADGRVIPINGNEALFSLLGTTYGGDGRSTFGLPDLRSRTPVGTGTGQGLTEVPLGFQRGAEQRTLTLATLPTHSHNATFDPSGGAGLQASTAGGESASPGSNSYLGKVAIKGMGTPPNLYTTDDSELISIQGLSAAGTVSVEATGGSKPFSIIPPQLGLLYCIATTGMFPPRQ